MRIRHWTLSWFLFLIAPSAFAETIELVCIHREYRASLEFEIDTLQNKVRHKGVLARDVHIDKSTISFVVDLTSGAYFHFISRPSGNMTVKAPDGTLIHGYQCAPSAAKF